MIAGAATAVTAAVSGMLQSRRQGEVVDKIRESLGQVQEHLSRIGNLGPDDDDPEGKKRDWAKHAQKHLNNAAEKWEKLKDKTRDEITRELDSLRDQIDKALRSGSQ
jgi:arginyl-tRNA synthetase